MFNFKNKQIETDPFNYMIIDDFLDKKVFKKLQSQIRAMYANFDTNKLGRVIPTDRYDVSKNRGSSLVFGGLKDNQSVLDIINSSKDFEGPIVEIIQEIFKEDVQKRIYRLLRPFNLFNINSIKPLKMNYDGSEIGFLDFIFYNNCFVSAKLSAYTSNAGLYHHIDHPDKVNALLLYIGFSDNIQRDGLGTQIYKVAKGQHKWSRKAGVTLDYYEDKKLIRHKDVKPLPNRLFAFNKGKYSWHGVYPIDLPEGVRRENIQINLYKYKNYSIRLNKFITLARNIKNKVFN